MRVFKIFTDDCDYDEYDSCIVIAENVEAVRAMMVREENYRYPKNSRWRIGEDVFFNDRQGELHIVEVDLNTPKVVLGSFNAG